MMINKTEFFNTFVNIFSDEEFLDIIRTALKEKSKKVFFYLNTYSFYLLQKNKTFEKVFNSAAYILPDGYSIKLAFKFLFDKEIKKLSPNLLLFRKIPDDFSKNQLRIFCLGAEPDTLKKAVSKMNSTGMNLYIVGSHHGFFNKKNTDNIIHQINKAETDVLLVGMGSPRQELWIEDNLNKINVNLIFTVGNLFDIIAGKKILAPEFLYNSPFEWIFRILQEPFKLFPRYLLVNPYFIYRVIKKKFLHNYNES